MAFGTPVVNVAHSNSTTSPYSPTVAAVTSGRIIVVQAYASRATSVTPTDISLTDNSGSPLTWTPVFATQPVSDNGTTRSKHQWWWAVADNATHQIDLASASTTAIGCEILDFSIGAGNTPDFTTNQASAEATTGTSTTTDPVCTLPTTPGANDLGLLFMMGQGGGALSAITGWTSLTRTSVNARSMNSAYDTSSPGQSVTWINNGNPAALITMVAVIETSSGGTYTEPSLTVDTVPISGLSMSSDVFALFEANLTVDTVPISGLTVTDVLGFVEGALTVGTVPISGLTVNDVMHWTEVALSLDTVPISGLTVTDNFGSGSYTEGALTADSIALVGLSFTDLFTGPSGSSGSGGRGRHRSLYEELLDEELEMEMERERQLLALILSL